MLGFSSGLPIMLVYSSIKIWLRKEGIDLSTIGYINWVTVPYSINFIWAPLLDTFYSKRFGRRRSWLMLTQVALFVCVFFLGVFDPTDNILGVVLLAGLVCFFSATQDIAVDAYRREILPDRLLGAGAALGVYGYRIGMWVASGLGLWIVDKNTLDFSFPESFQLIACFFLIGIAASLFAKEPAREKEALEDLEEKNSLKKMFLPLKDLLLRPSILYILLFIFLYKFGDALAGTMLSPYYVDLGFSNEQIAAVPKTLGLFFGFAGMAIGGAIIFRLGIIASLWVAGVLQALSTLSLSFLSIFSTMPMLTFVVAFEDVSSGMGTAALIAFMSQLTDRRFTATQYALMASIASLGRTLFAGFAGDMASYYGWRDFYAVCCFFAVGGLLCLYIIQRRKLSEV